MIQRILIDCDGVLSDFFTAACIAFDRSPASIAAETNIVKALADSDKEFWQHLATVPGFYEHMPPFHWTAEVVRILNSYTVRGITWEVVFGPSRVPDAREQRERWCRKNISPAFSAFRMGASKLNLVNRSELHRTLLIDDSPMEVDRFMEAGGVAILFPNGRNGRSESDPAWWMHDQIAKIWKTGVSPEALKTPAQEPNEVAFPY